jgi:hypothetical protein
MIRAAYADKIQYWHDNGVELRQAEEKHAANFTR